MKTAAEEISQLCRHEVRLGIRRVPVFGVSPESLSSPGLDHFLLVVQEALDQGGIMAVTGALSDYTGSEDDEKLAANDNLAVSSLAASLKEAYVFRLDNESIRGLLAAKHNERMAAAPLAVGTFLINKLGGSPQSLHARRSYPLLNHDDFQAFSHLWESARGPRDALEYGGKAPERALFMSGLGELLGKLHSLNVLHGDTHLGNFYMQEPGKVGTWDVGDCAFLLRPPTCHECACDFAGFLPELSPGDWAWFKRAYVAERKLEGACTINVVERGNEFRSATLFGMRRFEEALTMMEAELEESIREGNSDIDSLLTNLGVCCGQLGRYEEALSYCRRALDALDPDTPAHVRAAPIHNLAMAYYRLARHEEAIERFQQIVDDPAMQSHEGLWMGTLWHLAQSLCETGQDEEALHCVVRLLPLAEQREHPGISEIRKMKNSLLKANDEDDDA